MCEICEKVSPDLNKSQINKILDRYSELLLKGQNCLTVDQAIDILLNTLMDSRDSYEEAIWEEEYRNRDEN
jgi:hypothetical protein